MGYKHILKMIKANELRIGNCLCFLFKNGDLVTKKVTKLTAKQICKISEMDDVGDFWQPIPLTPEILEKCGFEGNNHKRRFKKVIESSLTMYFQDGIFSLEDYDWFAQNLDHIKYLHQLQNLYYSLTGTELEIKL